MEQVKKHWKGVHPNEHSDGSTYRQSEGVMRVARADYLHHEDMERAS